MTEILTGKKRFLTLLAGLAILLTLSATPASAQSITLGLGNNQLQSAGYSGPYGTVTVTLDVNTQTATFTFTSATPVYTFVGQGAVAVNINSDSFTWDNFSCTPASWASTCSPANNPMVPGNEDGFGAFNLSFNLFDGFNNAATTISFTVTNNSETTNWSSVADVLTPNANGYSVAAHIAGCSQLEGATGPCSTTVVTGYASTAVPEPASIALFGTGLVGLAGLIRRRRKT